MLPLGWDDKWILSTFKKKWILSLHCSYILSWRLDCCDCVCVAALLEQMDLSSVTDPLWKRFYFREFGEEHTNKVIARLKSLKETRSDTKYTWWKLFEVNSVPFFILCFHNVAGGFVFSIN